MKCIYIDPPYNTRSAFEHYDDNLEHSQWLSMIYPRLVLLREGQVAAAGPTDEVLTYQNLKAVFETEVYVDRNTLTGRLLVVPLSGRARRALRETESGDAPDER